MIQPVSGESAHTEFIARTGGGLHHLGFALEDRDQYQAAVKESEA